MQKLLTRHSLGALDLGHRVVMPGLLRGLDVGIAMRPSLSPVDAYAQRVTPGGLLLTEPVAIAAAGAGHGAACLPSSPRPMGFSAAADLAGWRRVTTCVHAKGGAIVAQLWHGGRLAHSPLGASRIPAHGIVRAADGSTRLAGSPERLDQAGIDAVIAAYRQAAEIARQLGFDGVELSAADGALPDQFLRDGTNDRTDRYGGAGRLCFLTEVLEALIDVWGADRVGVRLSPFGTLHDMRDSDPIPLFVDTLTMLNEREIAFVHLVPSGSYSPPGPRLYGDAFANQLRTAFRWPLIASGDYAFAEAIALVEGRWADAIGFDHWDDGPALLARLRSETR